MWGRSAKRTAGWCTAINRRNGEGKETGQTFTVVDTKYSAGTCQSREEGKAMQHFRCLPAKKDLDNWNTKQ